MTAKLQYVLQSSSLDGLQFQNLFFNIVALFKERVIIF